jgi:hypothetical protein
VDYCNLPRYLYIYIHIISQEMVVWRVFEIGHAKSLAHKWTIQLSPKRKQDLQTSARKRYHTWAVLSLIFGHGYMSEYVTTGETHLHPSTFTSSQKRFASLHHCPRGGEAHERLRLVKLFWSQDISLHSLGKKDGVLRTCIFSQLCVL